MNYTRLVAFVVVGSAFLNPALAQTGQTPPLKGPAVKDGSVPGEQRKFAGGGGIRDRMQGETPHRLFRQALDSLRGEKASDEVRLTADQDSRIREIEQSFFDEVAAFRQKHAEEVRALIGKLAPEDRRRAAEFLGRPGRPGGGGSQRKPGAGEGVEPMTGEKAAADPKVAQEARERLKEIMQSAPKAGDVHARMVAVLNDAQREVLKGELERVRKEAQKNREGEQVRRKTDKKNPGKVEGGKPAKPGKGLGGGEDGLSPRLKERLKNMTPEEREQALKRMRERQKERQPK